MSDAEDPRYYHVSEDPTEYSLWMDFRKHGNLFGVSADEVPALVRAGKDVWTFGYGWDQGDIEPGEYTTIGQDDLWAFDDPDDKGVVDSWGPFATNQPIDDPDELPVGDNETIVTIRVPLPSGVVTPFSIDTEGPRRRDALVAFLLAHGITPESSAPEPCAECGEPLEAHGCWSEDLSHTFN